MPEESMKTLSPPVSRRKFLASASRMTAAAYAAAHWMPLPALAESFSADSRIATSPVADKGFASIRQIGQGVYATISDRSKGLQTRSNGGFIIGRDASLLIEGFQTPIGAAFQVETYRSVSKVPIRAALNTHFHFDHTMGNSYYGGQGIAIWAHAKSASRMTARYPHWQTEDLETFLAPWEKRVREAKTDSQREHAKSDIEGLTGMFQPVSQAILALPNHPLDPAKMPMNIDLGGRTVVIEAYIGHTNTDLIFRVPDQNIVFTGDLLVDSQYPTNIDGYPTPWRATLAKLASFDKDTIFVPGHGQVGGLDRVALMRSVFDDIAEQAQKSFKAGVPVDEATERYVVPEKWKNFRMFSWGFCVGRTIQQFYSDWGKPSKILNYA
jgi:glyoxylase-like metal-dependent hydrolase (beta-lactamase superfamily II)